MKGIHVGTEARNDEGDEKKEEFEADEDEAWGDPPMGVEKSGRVVSVPPAHTRSDSILAGRRELTETETQRSGLKNNSI